MSDTDKLVAEAYRMADPKHYASLPDDEVLGVAKQVDPKFSQRYQAVSSKAWSDQNPVASAVERAVPLAKAAQSVIAYPFDKISQGLDAISAGGKSPANQVMQKVGGGINDAVSRVAGGIDDAADKVATSGLDPSNGVIPETMRDLSYALGMAGNMPTSVGGAIQAYALGKGISSAVGTASDIASGGSMSTASMPSLASIRAVLDPFTGKIAKMAAPDATAVAQSNYLGDPIEHNTLAQQHVADMQNATKGLVDLKRAQFSDVTKNNPILGEAPIDLSDSSRIANEKSEEIGSYPEFQSPAIKKMLGVFRANLDPVDPSSGGIGSGDIVGKHGGAFDASHLVTPGDQADFHESEPAGNVFPAKDFDSIRKGLNQIYSSKYGTPAGNLAKQFIDSNDAAFQRDAPDALKDAHSEALQVERHYYNTYFNDSATQKFLDQSPEKAHTFATSSLDNLHDIRDAGGEVALEHLRRSAGRDLVNQITDPSSNIKGDNIRAMLGKTRMAALRELISGNDYSDSTVERFADIADKHSALKEALSAPTTRENMIMAAKKAAAGAVGGAIGGGIGSLGGPFGTAAGAGTGAAIGVGLTDLLNK